MLAKDPGQYNEIKVKIADLGNGCWTHRHFTEWHSNSSISLPEVILGLYDTSADIWVVLFNFELHWDFYLNHEPVVVTIKWGITLLKWSNYSAKSPNEWSNKAKYSDEIFSRKYELRHIRNLDHWPLASVLQEKYHFEEEEANMIVSILVADARL